MLTQDDVIYFVVTDRFANGDITNDADVDLSNPEAYHGGDLPGIIDRLPYLQNLGVTAIWITPVFQSARFGGYPSWGYHGYWPLDFEKVDSHLYHQKPGYEPGSKKYLKEFVDAVHACGMKVVFDMVINHTGYDHPGLNNDPSTPIKSHWFNPRRDDGNSGDIGLWISGLPDLNADLPEVADYFVKVISDWIEETGIDCIRMDTAKYVDSIFWQYYKTIIKGKHPTVTLLGEVLEYDIGKISDYQKHFAFDTMFDFPFQRAIEDVFIREQSFRLISNPYSSLENPGGGVLDRDTIYSNHNMLVTLLDNHDLGERFYTRAIDKSQGDRPWATTTTKLALTLLLTSRGVPQIYYGTEIGMEGSWGNANRGDMPWEMMGNGLEPDSAHKTANELHAHTKKMVELRKSSEPLRYGEQITLYVDDRRYIYLRAYLDQWVIVGVNLDEHDMTDSLYISIQDNASIPPRLCEAIRSQRYSDLAGTLPDGQIEDGVLKVSLPKRSAIILTPKNQ